MSWSSDDWEIVNLKITSDLSWEIYNWILSTVQIWRQNSWTIENLTIEIEDDKWGKTTETKRIARD